MRTKTLLIAAAALAATVISSEAQVYSANIVGYTTQALPIGWANVNATFDLSGGDNLTNLFPNPGPGGGSNPLDFDTVYIWNGAGYSIYTLDSDYPSGVANAGDNAGVTSPTVKPGQLVYLLNDGGNINTTTTNVLTGVVHVDAAPTGSQSVGQTTNVLITGFNFVASKLPVAGGLTSVLGLSNPGPGSGNNILDFSIVYIPNIVNGAFVGYQIVTIDSDFSTGYANAGDNAQVAEPQIPVGAGVIIDYQNANGLGSTYTWVQAY
jgi:hypothetical protein